MRNTLTVSADSWHLGLVRAFSPDYQPRDLCSYFWTVVGAVLLAAAATLLIFTVLGLLGYALWKGWQDVGWWLFAFLIGVVLGAGLVGLTAMGIVTVGERWQHENNKRWKILIGLGWVLVSPLLLVVGVAMLIVAGVYFPGRWLLGRLPKREAAEKVESTSSPRLVWSFLVAKKHRICPLIAVEGYITNHITPKSVI